MSRLIMLQIIITSFSLCCSAFTVERSADKTWETAPSLESNSKTSIGEILDGKMQMTGMDKVLQSSEALTGKTEKNSERLLIQKIEIPREKRSEDPPVNAERKDIISVQDSENGTNVVGPSVASGSGIRNVILLLIDEKGKENETLWKDLEDIQAFPVQGLLKSCRDDTPATMRFSLNDPPSAVNWPKECDCEDFLQSHLDALLSWARSTKEMSTGTVSATNFSLPFPLHIFSEGSIEVAKDPEDLDEANPKPDSFGRFSSKPENSAWRASESIREKRSAMGLSPSTSPNVNGNVSSRYEGTWNPFNFFTTVRLAFFRTLLESLSNNLARTSDEFSHRRSSLHSRSNASILLADTIRELETMSNKKGYVLVATAPASELSSITELLQHEPFTKVYNDTLLAISALCPRDSLPVRFFARGPSAETLRDARILWELPMALKIAIESADTACRPENCSANRLPEAATLLFDPFRGNETVDVDVDELAPHKRLARNKVDAEPETAVATSPSPTTGLRNSTAE